MLSTVLLQKLRYYPKLVAAIPFTPASGKRILTHPGASSLVQKFRFSNFSTGVQRSAVVKMAAEALRQLSDANDFSSVHILFCEDDEATLAHEAGYKPLQINICFVKNE